MENQPVVNITHQMILNTIFRIDSMLLNYILSDYYYKYEKPTLYGALKRATSQLKKEIKKYKDHPDTDANVLSQVTEFTKLTPTNQIKVFKAITNNRIVELYILCSNNKDKFKLSEYGEVGLDVKGHFTYIDETIITALYVQLVSGMGDGAVMNIYVDTVMRSKDFKNSVKAMERKNKIDSIIETNN